MTRAVPVQARARARYEAILTAAKEHYAQVGRDRFAMDVVAEKAGCSVGTIYRYFEDRVGLLEAAVPDQQSAEEQLDKIRGIFSAEGDPETKLTEIGRALAAL